MVVAVRVAVVMVRVFGRGGFMALIAMGRGYCYDGFGWGRSWL